jgi:hypothetical protein
MPTHELDTGQFAPWNHLSSEFFMHIGDVLAELEAAYKEADTLRGTELERGGVLANEFSFYSREMRLTSDAADLYMANRKIRALEDHILWDLFEHRRKFFTE